MRMPGMSRATSAPGAFLMSLIPLSRRDFLAGTGLAVTVLSLPARAQAQSELVLHARPGAAALHGEGQPPTPIWGYEDRAPGPARSCECASSTSSLSPRRSIGTACGCPTPWTAYPA